MLIFLPFSSIPSRKGEKYQRSSVENLDKEMIKSACDKFYQIGISQLFT